MEFGYTAFLLGFGRVSGMMMTAPVWHTKVIPIQVKLFFSIILAVTITPFISWNQDLLQINAWLAISIMIQEVLVGLIMGFVANMSFYAMQIAGYFMDVPIGYSMVNILDINTGLEIPLLGQFNNILATLIFLGINGHHILILSLIKSFAVVKPGMFFMQKEATATFIQAFSEMFLLGFKISIPVIGAIFLTDIALGIISRLVPQINVFMVGFSVKILVGILILIVFLPVYIMIIENVFSYSGDAFKMIRLMLRFLTN